MVTVAVSFVLFSHETLTKSIITQADSNNLMFFMIV